MAFVFSTLAIFGFGILFLISLVILIILAIMKKRIKVVGIITLLLFVSVIVSIVIAFMTGPRISIDNENQLMTFEFMDETYEFDLTTDIQEQVDEFLLEYQNMLDDQLKESSEKESSRGSQE